MTDGEHAATEDPAQLRLHQLSGGHVTAGVDHQGFFRTERTSTVIDSPATMDALGTTQNRFVYLRDNRTVFRVAIHNFPIHFKFPRLTVGAGSMIYVQLAIRAP